MLLYYITDRRAFPGDERARRRRLLAKIGEAASAGINYIQLREKDLLTRELESLAREAVEVISKLAPDQRPATILLINSRTDLAIASGANGVHLRSDDISAMEVRKMWKHVEQASAIVGVSCHTADEVLQAEVDGADFAVFSPVFEKTGTHAITPAGLARLREASRCNMPVLALGGVTMENARACMEAGTAGIAGIRLFQENDIAQIVRTLRG